jgi:hypothetical protein
MKNKTCENCGKEFIAHRTDAKFCSSTCRSIAWNNSKEASKEEDSFKSQLKGLVNSNQESPKLPPLFRKEIRLIPNSKYNEIINQIKRLDNEYKCLEDEKQTHIESLNNGKFSSIGKNTLRGLGIGAVGGFAFAEKEERVKKAIKGGLLGGVGGAAIDLLTIDSRKKAFKKNLQKINVKISDINVKQTSIQEEKKKWLTSLKDIPENIEKEIEVKLILNEFIQNGGLKAFLKPTEKRLPNVIPISANVTKRLPQHIKPSRIIPAGSKIISSIDLHNMKYDSLGFQEKWHHLIGEPSVNFLCVIHGRAGEGKSTFAIQFANYLAENFGPVLYVSGEEGFSKTMKDKIVNNNATSENFLLADLRSFQDVIAEIKPNKYHFIFIDSLDNMHIGAQELKELKKIYANSALITISQSTKDGKIRGSNEIVHDSDIEISVSNGIAKTEKNRFLEKNRTYEIFEKDDGFEFLLPRNTVRG